jgi:hypothetical protein
MVLGSTIALIMLGSALLYPTYVIYPIGKIKLNVVPSCNTEVKVISP